jgi:hypothetical protein
MSEQVVSPLQAPVSPHHSQEDTVASKQSGSTSPQPQSQPSAAP